MENNQTVHEVMQDTEWAEAAREVKDAMEIQIANRANGLVSCILDHTCSVKELRAGVVWANALDAEAVRVGITCDSSQEALARRIAHHAGRRALARVSSRSRLSKMRSQAWFKSNKTHMF